jgi:hypothetical protein
MTVKSNSLVFLGLAVVLLIAPRRPPARHGLAAYDMTKVIVKPTVTEFAFINPHAAIHLHVKDDKGNTKDGSLKPTLRTIWPRLVGTGIQLSQETRSLLSGIAQRTVRKSNVYRRMSFRMAGSLNGARVTSAE